MMGVDPGITKNMFSEFCRHGLPCVLKCELVVWVFDLEKKVFSLAFVGRT